MSKLKRFLSHSAARQNPLRTILGLTQLPFLYAFRSTPTYLFRFGGLPVRFRFIPLGLSYGSNGIFVYRERYEDLLLFGHRFLRYDSVAIDCGANQGIFSCAFARYLDGHGHVYALEPLPYAARLLRSNLDLNSATNVTVIQAAVSDTNGRTNIDVSRGPVSASIIHDFGGDRTESVETVTLDHVVATHGITHVDFLKLDVEGAEFSAILGAQNLINRFRPVICVEAHTQVDFDRISKQLPDYSAFVFNKNGELVHFAAFTPQANVYLLPIERPTRYAVPHTDTTISP